MSEKKKSVPILVETGTEYEWRDCSKGFLPVPNMPVVVCITRDDITSSNGTHPEDMKMAMLVPDEDGLNMTWQILAPYMKFENNQLTNGPDLLTGAYISHWAMPHDNDLESYLHRFDIKGKYDMLNVMVDNDHLPLLYFTILHAMFYIRSAAEEFDHESDKYKQYMNMITLLGDIENCIDKNVAIMNGQECSWKIEDVPPLNKSEEDTGDNDVNHKKDNQ